MKTKPDKARYDDLDPGAFRAWLVWPDGTKYLITKLSLHQVERLIEDKRHGAPAHWGHVEHVALFWPIPDDEYEIEFEVKHDRERMAPYQGNGEG